MDLVLLRLSALGDILRVLPAWANLHRAFPAARFRAVVEDRHAFLLEPLPWIEPVVLRRRRLSSPFTALPELRRVARELEGAEASLDFHGILKSALIPRLAGIPERWGDGVTKEGAAWMQTHPLPWKLQTRYEQALGLAEAFGQSRGVPGLGRFHPALKEAELPTPSRGPGAGDRPLDRGIGLEVSSHSRLGEPRAAKVPLSDTLLGQSLGTASAWEDDGLPRIVLVPGASKRGALKRWPLHHWIALARLLQGRAQLRWSLGPEEADLRSWLPVETSVPALPAGSLWELAALLRQADRVVAPDTGLLHLAVVLGVPALGLYGASHPEIAGLPQGVGSVLRTGIECSPCRERACLRRQCMEELHPVSVAEALLRCGPRCKC